MKSNPCWLVAGWLCLVPPAFATQTNLSSPPPVSVKPQPVARKPDAATLDRYAGYYRFGDHAVLTILHGGDSLSVQLTGQPAGSIVAVNETEFVNDQFGARFTFQTDESGQVTGVVLDQRGQTIRLPRIDEATAHSIEDATLAHVKSQTPARGSEAALRRLIEAARAGTPNYEEMSPGLADAMRAQEPQLKQDLEGWGPIQSIRFLHVGNQGNDIYEVHLENRTTQWSITLGADGKIESALVRPPSE
jgi:hypothetical protein